MTDVYQALIRQFRKLSQIDHAITFLQWDNMVMMPPGGSESRSEAIAELSTMYHSLLTSSQTGDLLKEAMASKLGENRQSLTEMKRTYDRAACLPGDLVKAKSLAGSKCEHHWRTQKENNDWSGFLRNFKEVVYLAREEAQARQATNIKDLLTPYDAMLDLYLTGDSSEFITSIFNTLKGQLPHLLANVIEKQRNVKFKNFRGRYPLDKQKRLCRTLAGSLGFDFTQGRLDVSTHPFSTGCRGDQRITTRFHDDEFFEALLATAHETGHASYENGLPIEWDGLPIGEARNLCIHESQSLLFEKQLFLSRPFLDFFIDKIRAELNLDETWDAEQLWTSATQVKPSFIRVEADEVTYPLHVILRYEIESKLINQTLEAEDIPEVWDQGMRDYLGISSGDNHKAGCLQDMHWSDGSFGYFPSYTIGAINSAQLFNAIRRDNPNWQDLLKQGETGFVRDWLSTKIWAKGSSLSSQEIMVSATGEGTNPQVFLSHLKDRYIYRKY